ncbi:MAG: beta-CASP ribonuclease aCPSF1 [Candidatus Aenigmarchaeota archaeon]|nr:beta-CASP ribonuclease aCPSF1 [Candidatus Aenigmarchaeota archaeon]
MSNAGNVGIIEQVKGKIPKDAEIEEIVYEGPDIILYTSNKEFAQNSMPLVKSIVSEVKKRVEVRAHASILADEETTEKLIREKISADAGVRDIYFEPEFAKVIIHAEKPGMAIGKAGLTLQNIKKNTFWTPEIKRTPAIDSEIIATVRRMLHKEAGYRKKFLHNLGLKIYGESKPVEWIRVTGLGSFREVGRSALLLQTPQSRVLLDCGVAFGSRQFPYLDVPEFDIQRLDAIVASHAHLDHVGLIPYLYEYGFRGPLFCTRPTRDLSILLQLDYIGVAQKEGGKAPYSSKGIEEMVKHCVSLEYGQVTDITADIRLTLENSGHIIGASTCHFNIGNGLYNLLYSGDIKYEKTKMFNPTYTDYARVEGLIIESTYGDEDVPSHIQGEHDLIASVKEAIERGGKVLIPTFAVGRAQDVIVMLIDAGLDVPIILDGMLWDATAIHTAYPEFMSKEMQLRILKQRKNPFVDPRLKGIGSGKERREVLNISGPAVILATSGMMQGGPIVEYTKEFSGDPKNMLLFVGYQAEATLGRRIQKGWKFVPMEGDDRGLELKLEIRTIKGLSGHSGKSQLLDWIRHLKATPKRIICNHGESSVSGAFARLAHSELRVETSAPKLIECVRLR